MSDETDRIAELEAENDKLHMEIAELRMRLVNAGLSPAVKVGEVDGYEVMLTEGALADLSEMEGVDAQEMANLIAAAIRDAEGKKSVN